MRSYELTPPKTHCIKSTQTPGNDKLLGQRRLGNVAREMLRHSLTQALGEWYKEQSSRTVLCSSEPMGCDEGIARRSVCESRTV